MGILQNYLRRSFGSRIIAGIAVLLCGACAPSAKKDTKTYLSECSVPTDQATSMYGRWKKLAVPIVFRAGQWTTEEMNTIMDAADVWNSFYSSVSGIRVLDYGSRSAPNSLTYNKPAGDICSYTIFDDVSDRYTSGVLIFKHTTWPYTSLTSAIALTSYCKRASTGRVAQMFMGLMETNFQNFFVSGKKVPDLKSIFVHEFGHLLGLDHSCVASAAAGTAGLAACANVVAAKPEYLEAVMYPTVRFTSDGVAEVKTELQSNDQQRGNCLYGTSAI